MSYTDARRKEFLEDALAEDRFDRAVGRVTRAWTRALGGLGDITGFRNVAMYRPDGWVESYTGEKVATISDFAMDPANAKMWTRAVDESYVKSIANGLAAQSLARAELLLDSASIVFAHSVMEEALVAYLESGSLAKPDVWAADLASKKLSYSEVSTKEIEVLTAELTADHLQQIERRSLVEKARIFMARFPPPAREPNETSSYVYDEVNLEFLDRQRTAIVHGEGLAGPEADWDARMFYLLRTVTWWIACLNETTGLRIDPTKVGSS
jgi:hypothetical protein